MRFRGSCHCGSVIFSIETADLTADVYKCNCSLCVKKSIIMKPVDRNFFSLIDGAEELLCYQWNKYIAEHYFCKNCGVYTHHRRRRDPNQISVNYACIDQMVGLSQDQIGLVDGASHE